MQHIRANIGACLPARLAENAARVPGFEQVAWVGTAVSGDCPLGIGSAGVWWGSMVGVGARMAVWVGVFWVW